MIAAESRLVEVPGGFAVNTTLTKGAGAPLVFLHGPFGQEWSGFLDDLATHYRVYAPAHPGAAEPEDLQKLDSLWDLMLYYDDLFTTLQLDRVDLIGHSFGGMVAAEFAATFPHRVRKLVLIDALGLWRDDAPVSDHVMVPPETQVGLLYHDASKPEIAAKLSLPADPDEQRAAIVHRFSSIASTSHFIWPIPERGLAKRLRRVRAETLVLWGKQDTLTPPVYAEEFAARIPGAQVQVIESAGHVPQVEQREVVARRVLQFLASNGGKPNPGNGV
jgi:pimeloyl-ACP methyl ester carboxylesterase